MNENFFPSRALFWTFWANFVFIIGMVGYLAMDSLDYMRPNTFHPTISGIIYVILACIFVADSSLQMLGVFNIHRNTHRYYAMVSSCIFDKIGSDSYLLGAIFSAAAVTNSNITWTCNTIGVVGFLIGAIINMVVPRLNVLNTWANYFNLAGASLYLLATIVTRVPFTQVIVIFGDLIYLICAILYKICWFHERKLVMAHSEQIGLVKK